jgi:hypothetical protein
MKRLGATTCVLFLNFVSAALGQSDYDKQSDGKFTGLAFITEDVRWYEQFSQPEMPAIDGKNRFLTGERGALALIFSNAEPKDGEVRIECEIVAIEPNGQRTAVGDPQACYRGPYFGDNILHPTLVDLQFEVAEGDPSGQAGFQITMRDVYSGRQLELNVAYQQEQGR